VFGRRIDVDVDRDASGEGPVVAAEIE